MAIEERRIRDEGDMMKDEEKEKVFVMSGLTREKYNSLKEKALGRGDGN